MQSEVDAVFPSELYLQAHPLIWKLDNALRGRNVVEVR